MDLQKVGCERYGLGRFGLGSGQVAGICECGNELPGYNTGCPGGYVPDFERMFLTLKYTDITQNTYIRS